MGTVNGQVPKYNQYRDKNVQGSNCSISGDHYDLEPNPGCATIVVGMCEFLPNV